MIESESSNTHEGKREAVDPDLLALLSAVRRQPPPASAAPFYGALPNAPAQNNLRFIVWILGGMIGLIVLVLAVDHWVTSLNTLSDRVGVVEVKAEATRVVNEAQQKIIDLNYKEITSEDRKRRITEHDEMWQMRKNGQSNKEAFWRDHGYAAPSMPGVPKE
jgi:hypothetical protein